MALFFHQFLQLFGHAVKLHRQQIKLVLASGQLMRYAGFQVASGQAVHAARQQADGLGDVAGQNIGGEQAHHHDKTQNNEFMPNRCHRQAGNQKRAGRARYLFFVPIAHEKQVFLAQAVVGYLHQRRFGVHHGVFVCQLNGGHIHRPRHNVGFVVAANHI